MSKKNKKKNNNKNSVAVSSSPVPTKVVESISDEQVEKIEAFDRDEMPKAALDIPADQLTETQEDDGQVAEIRKKGNVDKYIEFLRDKLKRLNAIVKRNENIQLQVSSDREALQSDKQSFEKFKEEEKVKLDSKCKELNQREKKIQEAQLAIDNGEYTSVIQGLLDTLRKTEQDITSSTRTLIDDLGKKHQVYVADVRNLMNGRDDLANKESDFETRLAEIVRKERRLEVLKKVNEQKIRHELEDEYADKISKLEDENLILSGQKRRLEEAVADFADLKEKFLVAFPTLDVKDILQDQQALKGKCKALQIELDKRPSYADYQSQLEEITVLKTKNNELSEKINEERLAQLKVAMHNADAYIQEINCYKAKIDSAEAREKSLSRTVKDLQETINRLKDETSAKDGAFEQTRRMDNDAELQNRKPKPSVPKSLQELVNYLQAYMARLKEPFYYEKKTIRTFLAGMNMSPLTILQGISGTGKTSLPREVAKALVANSKDYRGKDESGNRKEPYRICAVQSGWRDNMDLMGFYNNFEKKYKETDFFRALYLATQPKYKDTLFLIVLDEMNLSHPEHYFADFLSMMEQREDDRLVRINVEQEMLPALFKDRQMLFPRNVRFIGTANHDETTLDFAPKTYDRANVMVMETNERKSVEMEIKQTGRVAPDFFVNYAWLEKEFRNSEEVHLAKYNEFEKFAKNENLVEMLAERGIGIGNRFDKQARKFICTYLSAGGGTGQCFAEAADHLMTSRLFRSLRNRYDLSRENLADFSEFYKNFFSTSFGVQPSEAMKLFESEMAKK